MEERKHHYNVSWDQLHRDVRALSWKLMDIKSDWTGVIAITRGGMIPAAIIARELSVRLVDTVCLESYNHQKQHDQVSMIKNASVTSDGKDFLLIDDLVDTGKTAKFVRELFPQAHFATVYAKPLALDLVDSFVTELSQDTWIYFPWDLDLSFSQPLSGKPD